MKLTSKRLVSILLCLAFVLAMLPMAVMAAGTYCVAGEAGLCGVGWDAASNAMTANGDGTYSITFANVAKGTYQFKVTDGSWANSWGLNGGSKNNKVAVETACDVTITFNPETKETVCTGSGVAGGIPDMVIDYIVAVGAGANGFLNDITWDPAAEANIMTNNNGVYTITYEGVVAGSYEFKFAANGSWSDSWGNGVAVESGVVYDAWYNGQNFQLTVAEDDSDVTLTLDLTAMDYKTGAGAKASVLIETAGSEPTPDPDPEVSYYIVGSVPGCSWDITDATHQMTLNGSSGLYFYTFENVPAANKYEVKIHDQNNSWDSAWPAMGNYEFGMTADGNVKVEFDPATGSINVVGDTVCGVIEVVPEMLTVAGDAGICGSAWDPADTNNAMTLGEDGRYYKTFENVAAGEYQFKVTDGTWSNSWGGDAPGGNYACSVSETSTVTVYFTWETKLVEAVVTPNPVVPVYHDVKWQLTAGTTAESASTDLRLVSWVSSLDVTSVAFNVTIDGETTPLNCTAVYSAINVDGLSVDNAAEVFGNDEAAYFVTYCINGIPADAFGSEIEVSVTWTDAEGNVTTSEARTIVISDAL